MSRKMEMEEMLRYIGTQDDQKYCMASARSRRTLLFEREMKRVGKKVLGPPGDPWLPTSPGSRDALGPP